MNFIFIMINPNMSTREFCKIQSIHYFENHKVKNGNIKCTLYSKRRNTKWTIEDLFMQFVCKCMYVCFLQLYIFPGQLWGKNFPLNLNWTLYVTRQMNFLKNSIRHINFVFHLRSNSQQKFQCPECDYKATHEGNLAIHLKSLHTA